MTIINQINLFEMYFGSSFIATARRIYSVSFDNSNVIENQLKLGELLNNVKNNITTDEYNGVPISIDDVQIVIGALEELVKYYCAANGIYTIPSRLKLYNLTREIRDYEEKNNQKESIKEMVKEIFEPKNQGEEKSKRKSKEELIELKSKERALNMLKKRRK